MMIKLINEYNTAIDKKKFKNPKVLSSCNLYLAYTFFSFGIFFAAWGVKEGIMVGIFDV